MRKIFFLVIVLFAMQHLSAQKFVLMKDTERIESKDSCVYRVEGYDQLISKEKFRHHIVIRSRSLESAWLDWLRWSVLPREIRPFIKKCEPGLARPMFGPRRLFNTYRGLMLEFVLDGHGNIITVFFYVSKEIRDKITEKHLKKMYNAIMKHKMPLPVVEKILALKKEFYKWNDLSPDSTRIRCQVDIGEQIEFFEELKNFDWQELKEIRKEREKKWKEYQGKKWKALKEREGCTN
mgnify:FL=1